MDGSGNSAESKKTIQSLAKGFRVLEAFSPSAPQLTITEIAKSTGLDPGTVYRVVNTLSALGYLKKADSSRHYRLTLKILDLGFNAIGRTDLRSFSRPVLRSLVGEVNEAASLAALDGTEVVYVERVHAGLARLGVDTRIGTRLPAYCTAIGIAILAHLPDPEVVRILEASDLVKLTPKTPVTRAEIETRMKRVRRNGYILSDGEVVTGLRVLAVPILDVDGYPAASVSVAAPSVRMPLTDFLASALNPLQRAAADIGKLLQLSGAVSPANATTY